MISDVQEEGNLIPIDGDKDGQFYAINDTAGNQKPFNRVLDILVERSLRLAIVNDSWKAEDKGSKKTATNKQQYTGIVNCLYKIYLEELTVEEQEVYIC